MRDHRQIDARSLEFGRAIADKLAERPELIITAKDTVVRWMRTCSPRAIAALKEWETILNGPMTDILKALTSLDERSVRLRQSNPFAGALTQQERNKIIRQFESYDAATT